MTHGGPCYPDCFDFEALKYVGEMNLIEAIEEFLRNV